MRKPKRRRPAPGGNHPEDVLEFADFTSFGELLGPEADERARFEFDTEVRARLLAARRRVARFAKGTIERELELGREATPASPIVFGVGGLRHSTSQHCSSPADKSQAALSLLLASQRYGVPIAPTELQGTFHNAGDWLVRGPELGQIFYEERGGLAETFTFLAQLEGAEERLFPGYARFESSLDNRVLTERKWLRGPLEREKQRILERHVQEGRQRLAKSVSIAQFGDPIHGVAVAVEAALLDSEHLAAVKLALKTKRLPLTPDDVAVRGDETRPLHERFSTGLSEIPLAEYYVPFWVHGGFTPETIRITEFLVANRRAFKERSQAGPIDGQQVAEFRRLCPSENLLRALFVFTSADRAELWESAEADPARWFNTRELYLKTLLQFRRAGDPAHALQGAGYSADQLAILRDFGVDFFGGVYRRYANRFGAHLVRLVEEPAASSPKAGLLHDGTATIVGVAARDYRGLAATISGALWHQGVSLRQAHLFSATQHGLALDFFHLAPGIATPKPDLTKVIEDAIERQLYIGELDEAGLPRVTGTVSLEEWRPGQYCLRSEMSDDVSGLIYALAYKVFRHLRGAIFGLTAHAAKGKSFASIYLNLPPDLSLEAARSIVAIHFR